MSKAKRVIHKTTDAERREYLAKIDSENMPELKIQGRRVKAELEQERTRIEQACLLLKAERESQGISLSDVAEKTGMSRGAISRLENLVDPNPTVSTLIRLASALGKQLVITLVPGGNTK